MERSSPRLAWLKHSRAYKLLACGLKLLGQYVMPVNSTFISSKTGYGILQNRKP